MMSCLATLGLRVLIDLRKGSKCSVGCGLAVFLLGVMCPMVAWHLFLLRCLCIQGVWTVQRFPLSSYEVSGSWSYCLAGKAAAIEVFGWRSGGYRVAGFGQQCKPNNRPNYVDRLDHTTCPTAFLRNDTRPTSVLHEFVVSDTIPPVLRRMKGSNVAGNIKPHRNPPSLPTDAIIGTPIIFGL
ncbi:unnamed protein product [Brassica oleracea]|uniref:(rape) hypothetical protein n=1 Tax=Brassica napus TaxID=3708 RepID=A0A816L4K2_BRANA|nr:unnamed protein product [Brassica napus]